MARSFSYDMENRQTTATVAGIGNTYKYDGEGRRVISNAWGQTTVHVYDAFGQLAASYGPDTATGTAYLTADALGSTRLIVPASTGPVQNFDYFPFGAEIPSGTAGRDSSFPAGYPVAPGGMPLKFTGKERDSETGLDYFGARYFSAAQGRFTSPDPAAFTSRHIANPQKWNKYAYVLNNPLIMIDPDGEAEFYVFRPEAQANNRAWTAIQNYTNRPGSPDHMTIYNGPAATAERFTNALNTEGAHVIDAGGDSVEDNQGNAVGILVGGNTGVGNPAFTTDVGPAGTPLVPVGDIKASDVAVMGCNSTQLAPQFSDATFTGTMPTTNTVAEDAAAATYTDKLVRGGTVDQAANAAAGTMRTVTNQANANPNRVMDYRKPQVCTTENGKTTCHGRGQRSCA